MAKLLIEPGADTGLKNTGGHKPSDIFDDYENDFAKDRRKLFGKG